MKLDYFKLYSHQKCRHFPWHLQHFRLPLPGLFGHLCFLQCYPILASTSFSFWIPSLLSLKVFLKLGFWLWRSRLADSLEIFSMVRPSPWLCRVLSIFLWDMGWRMQRFLVLVGQQKFLPPMLLLLPLLFPSLLLSILLLYKYLLNDVLLQH